ncbi:unnamed protein product [Urochloa humidicola]
MPPHRRGLRFPSATIPSRARRHLVLLPMPPPYPSPHRSSQPRRDRIKSERNHILAVTTGPTFYDGAAARAVPTAPPTVQRHSLRRRRGAKRCGAVASQPSSTAMPSFPRGPTRAPLPLALRRRESGEIQERRESGERQEASHPSPPPPPLLGAARQDAGRFTPSPLRSG